MANFFGWLNIVLGNCMNGKVVSNDLTRSEQDIIEKVYKNEVEPNEKSDSSSTRRRRKNKRVASKDIDCNIDVSSSDNQNVSQITTETFASQITDDSDSKSQASVRKSQPKFRAKFDHKITDKYDIKALIGRGNFSRVVRVEHKQTRQPYAIKMIDKHSGDDVSEAELSVLQRVRHPFIIQLIEYFDTPDKCYLVMELATGGELFDRIISKKHFTEVESIRVLEMVLDGLKVLHRLGFAHRDLKPENLLYYHPGDDSRLMITDFGLSANCKTQGGLLSTVCGTPEYISPEILMRQPYNCQVDMWAVGVLTYILLSGSMPFDDDSRGRLYRLIYRAKYSYEDEVWRDVSPVAKDFIDRLLVVDPDQRMTASQALKHPWVSQNSLLGASFSRGTSSLHKTLSKTSSGLLRRQSVASSRSFRSGRSNRSSQSTRSLRSEAKRVLPEEIDALHNDPFIKAEMSSLRSGHS